jgi:hypothetical protein
MAWEPKEIIFGIRHKRLFGFLSRAGDIIDAVLRLGGTGPSPDGCFSKIGWPDQVTVQIGDDDEHFVANCNIEGLVLRVNMEELELGRDQVKDAFMELCRMVLGMSGGDRSVNRFGIIDTYMIEHRSPNVVALETITRLGGIGEPANFAFKASFRTPTDDGLVRGGVYDWRNTILQIGTGKKGEDSERPDAIRVSLDYQIYFSPERNFTVGLVDEHYREFLDRAGNIQERQLAGLAATERTG